MKFDPHSACSTIFSFSGKIHYFIPFAVKKKQQKNIVMRFGRLQSEENTNPYCHSSFQFRQRVFLTLNGLQTRYILFCYKQIRYLVANLSANEPDTEWDRYSDCIFHSLNHTSLLFSPLMLVFDLEVNSSSQERRNLQTYVLRIQNSAETGYLQNISNKNGKFLEGI